MRCSEDSPTLRAGNFHLLNKLRLDLDGKKVWIFHGDVFDLTMRYSKFVAKLGGLGYNLLIYLNSLVNTLSQKMGQRQNFPVQANQRQCQKTQYSLSVISR